MLFTDNTRRRAPELMADLANCRQFRHLSEAQRREILEKTFLRMAEAWMGREKIKHPDPSNPCTACGRPRSKYSVNSGLCFRCYAAKGIEDRELWAEDVFEEAVSLHGVMCDACGDIHRARITAEIRIIAINILDNMSGVVRPILCQPCAGDFKSFCSRNYGYAAWRILPPREVERMSLAWFAQKVKVLAEKKPEHRKRRTVGVPS